MTTSPRLVRIRFFRREDVDMWNPARWLVQVLYWTRSSILRMVARHAVRTEFNANHSIMDGCAEDRAFIDFVQGLFAI